MTGNDVIWFAVVNPNAGSGKTLARWRDAEGLLFEKGIRYKFAIPESSRDSSRRIKRACMDGFRHFIAVGGDGTVHHVLKAIVEFTSDSAKAGHKLLLSDFTMAVLPIGSGNDWLKSHNIPANHDTIINLISRKSFAPQDVVMAQTLDPQTGNVLKTAYMANIGGYGLDADICDVVNFQKANGVTGKLIYINAIRKQLLRLKPSEIQVFNDGKLEFDGPVFSMSLGNGKYSGGGLVQTPYASLDDGMLDATIVPQIPLLKAFTYVNKFIRKRVDEIPILKFIRGTKMEIIPKGQGQLIEIDGEIIGRAPARFTVMEQKINVLDARV